MMLTFLSITVIDDVKDGKEIGKKRMHIHSFHSTIVLVLQILNTQWDRRMTEWNIDNDFSNSNALTHENTIGFVNRLEKLD